MYTGRQMYFYYLEWLFVYNKGGYLHITVLLFLNNLNKKLVIYNQPTLKFGYLANNQKLKSGYF